MSRLTYKSKDGSWGLKGLSWEQLERMGFMRICGRR